MRDCHDFEVEVELASGCVVAIRYQSVDEEDRRPHELENEFGAVASLVKTNLEDLFRLEVGRDALVQHLHELRVETRRELAAWATSSSS